MSAPSDRNLLFGILAHQMAFVSREALLEGMQAWLLAKEVPLAEHLQRRGALSPEHRQLLEPLVDAHIRLHAGDAKRSLLEVSSLGELQQELSQLDDEQLGATLSYVAQERQSTIHETSSATPAAASAAASQSVRFRILRPHAEGGLGQVFLARDEEVGRDVALKEIKPRWADHPGSRARFLREAEITGGLEHPGIVPVYGLGAYPDGRPYYAMRFIRGSSLKEAIEAFHQAAAGEPLSATERTLELRRLLQRLIDVCEAIDYAHSRGVLHRDLKPGNVMLGRYGETLVVDWGLAKALSKSPQENGNDGGHTLGSPHPAEGPLAEAPADNDGTKLGSAIGTPAFMSPEQAQGRLDLLGPASDVFSLGATLYQLLAGVPPYVGQDLVRQAQEAEYPLPRSIRADIPRPLEAICLRAMAPAPQDRYATAKELASEIERWLANEPVNAYSERPAERALRWARKHRAWVTVGGLALAAVTLVSTLAFIVVSFQNWRIANLAEAEKQARLVADQRRQEAETARDDEAQARRETEIAHRQARRDRGMLAEIIDQIGADVYRNRRHRPLLESSVTHYRDFLEQDAHAATEDPLVRARFQAKLATLLEALDDYAGAKAAYQTSIAQYQALLDAGAAANERQLRSELGSTYGNLGAMYVQTPETVAALAALDKAIAIQQKLHQEDPQAADDQRELARHSYNRGFLRAALGVEGAIDDLRSAVTLQKPLAEQSPQSTDVALELAVMQLELGTREAQQASHSLSTTGLLNLRARQAAQQKLREGQQIIEEGLATLQQLVAGDSQHSEYRKELADGQAELGQVLAMSGDLTAAEASLRKSLSGFEELLQDFPADPDFQRGLGLARFSLALVKELSRDPPAAQEGYRSAIEIQEQLVKKFPDRALYWTDAAKSWTNLASVGLRQKELEEAMAAIKTAVAHFRRAWQMADYDERLRPAVYQAYAGLAQIAMQTGDHAALAELGKSHAQLVPQRGQDLYDSARLIALAVPLAAKDAELSGEQREETAEKYAHRAMELLRRAVQQGAVGAKALQNEPDLSSLRSRREFQELLDSTGKGK